MEAVANYTKVQEPILQTLNLSPEAYHWHLREISFRPDYHSLLTGQKIRANCLRWLWLVVQMTSQMAELIMVEHYISVLPFKPKNWVVLSIHNPRGGYCVDENVCLSGVLSLSIPLMVTDGQKGDEQGRKQQQGKWGHWPKGWLGKPRERKRHWWMRVGWGGQSGAFHPLIKGQDQNLGLKSFMWGQMGTSSTWISTHGVYLGKHPLWTTGRDAQPAEPTLRILHIPDGTGGVKRQGVRSLGGHRVWVDVSAEDGMYCASQKCCSWNAPMATLGSVPVNKTTMGGRQFFSRVGFPK